MSDESTDSMVERKQKKFQFLDDLEHNYWEERKQVFKEDNKQKLKKTSNRSHAPGGSIVE